ncbi:branched-chain amino acid ABC transporter permease [Piscinibacter sakaiensis]|uniref:branched-chain amino acid ABC transporter permease n=1 Tax=Piscinibacter sakaiensis TaxID=1547922 RepID=UPI003AACFF4D
MLRSASTLRMVAWLAYALILFIAPLVFTSSLAMTMLTQMGYLIIICLSYNLLLGQGGMLSFGHAVYVGLGSFFVIHALNFAAAGRLPVPVSLMPLVGGLAGMAVAALLGWVTTKKAATPFAMITLGVGELVFSMSLMFPGFFGGEGGISANRVIGEPFFGLSYGPQVEVYYLIAIYCLLSTAAMYALTLTPLGRMLNAVRDNPERVAFIGYNTQVVRYIAFVIAGFFAGIGGGLQAINFESVTAETLSGLRSGGYLLFTFVGGAMFFFGPIIGGVLLVLAIVMFSEITKAWQIYLGLGFMLMVMFAPGGIASLIMMNLRVATMGHFRRLLLPYLLLFATGAVALGGSAAIIEMIYHVQLDAAMGSTIGFLGWQLDTSAPAHWLLVIAVTAVGGLAFEWARRRFVREWDEANQRVERELKRMEAA